MGEAGRGDDLGDLDGLYARAETLAGAWSAPATAATTLGRERAILRLFGVHGLDRTGRPLAAEVVDRYLAEDPRRLAGGIALPFAIAMVEYDLPPQELALEIAGDGVDLALEAELLAEPDRRAVAETEASRLARSALERIDANRTARRELLGLLGDPPRPWIGTALDEPSLVHAIDEAADAVAAGVDLVRVEVPAGRELAERLADAGVEVEPWRPRYRGDGADASGDPTADVPAGSQRGLAALRRVIDEAAAERRSYVRLATSTAALAAPDQAVVAAFERVDVVFADAVGEIVEGRVDPDRALADHAFAHRLLRRAGSLVLVDAGPLVVAPDLETGVPSDATTRSGRALALQLLGVLLARRDGLEPERLLVGALPDWLVDEAGAAGRAAVEVALRRALLPGHPLAFVEPAGDEARSATWLALVGALLPDAGPVGAVVRRPGPGLGRRARASRAAAEVGGVLAEGREPMRLRGRAMELARATVAAAIATLERLDGDGWRSVLGEPIGSAPSRLGADAVVDRTETFDPFAELGATG